MTPTSNPRPTVVLCHGAWEGPWVWEPVRRLLPGHYDVRVPDLPSAGATDDPLGDLSDDAAAIAAAISDASGPILLVAHSMGGAAMTQAAGSNPAVSHLIYVAAFVPDVGESCMDQLKAGPGPMPHHIRMLHGDYAAYDTSSTDILNGCSAEMIEWARPRWRVQRMAVAAQPVTAAGWRTIPSSYVLALADVSISADTQRQMAARTNEVVEVDTGHMVPLTRPDVVADMIVRHSAIDMTSA